MNGGANGGSFGWVLVGIGLLIAAAGLLWLFVPGISRLGRLPGDVVIEGKNGRFYFPITTSIILSVVLSLALWIAARISGGGN